MCAEKRKSHAPVGCAQRTTHAGGWELVSTLRKQLLRVSLRGNPTDTFGGLGVKTQKMCAEKRKRHAPTRCTQRAAHGGGWKLALRFEGATN